MQKRVSIIGLGYIGLPTAIVAAENGLTVIGVDIDAERVAKINVGEAVIQEPGVAEKLKSVVANKSLRATTQAEPADFHIIAVPTPFQGTALDPISDQSLGRRVKLDSGSLAIKKADLSYVWSAAQTVANVLRPGDTVILESTVPVGTTEALATLLEQKTNVGKAGTDFFVAHCPERVLPGKIFHELVHNARIIGGINPASVERAKEFYKSFVTGGLYLTDAKTAEMVKLVENSSRDVAIAFANQVASMAQAIGLNGYEVIELANKHPRVNILKPGCGVGGHCIAVDPWFLIEGFPEQTHLLHAARTVNDAKPNEVISTVEAHINARFSPTAPPHRAHSELIEESEREDGLAGKNKDMFVLILGATYKPDVDDLRESPALYIAQTLNKKYTNVLICEPNVPAEQLMKKGFSADQIVTFEEGMQKANLVVALVSHSAFKNLVQFKQTKKIIDYCGLLHTPRQETAQQERLYWPASSTVAWDEAVISRSARSKDLDSSFV